MSRIAMMKTTRTPEFNQMITATGNSPKHWRGLPRISFMDMPLEVRDMIYSYATDIISLYTCTHTYCYPSTLPSADPDQDKTALSLLLVNKAVRTEVSRRLLHNCELHFDDNIPCSGYATGLLKCLLEPLKCSTNTIWQNLSSAFFSKIRTVWFNGDFPDMLRHASTLAGALRKLSFFRNVRTINITHGRSNMDFIRGRWDDHDLVEGPASTLTVYAQTLVRDGSARSLHLSAEQALAGLATVYKERSGVDGLRELLLSRSADGRPLSKYPVSIRIHADILLCLCGRFGKGKGSQADHTQRTVVYDWDTREILGV